jgi:hypothetical protein
VSDVSLDNQDIFILTGKTVSLFPKITLANVAVSWQSDNTSVATVDADGTVTGVGDGTTEITVTPEDGGKAATVSVRVVSLSYNITDEARWDAVFAAISREPDGASVSNPAIYNLNVTGDFSVKGRTSSNITGNYKKVQLTGGGKVTLSSPGSIIQTATDQTFIINGPTLVGKDNNNRSVVYLNSGSAELTSGTISGNTTESQGGGVYVTGSGASFTMSGGTISGNKATQGGGVYVNDNSASFTMSSTTTSNGTISGNTASSGGGVYIANGTFTMSGGGGGMTISGNTASSGGGGVNIDKGTFMMTGNDKISDNKATTGGGVFVGPYGTFTMSNGTISGNTASGRYGGGGVYVRQEVGSATFMKTGGTIYGESIASTTTHAGGSTNTATNTADNIGKNGHAVMLCLINDLTYFYRNSILGTGNDLDTTGLTWNSENWAAKGFEGVRN